MDDNKCFQCDPSALSDFCCDDQYYDYENESCKDNPLDCTDFDG